jgi:glycosyltransferase involved in cell wall biosynthesis
MRIAIVAPLFERIPPRQYGGTERVVHWLVEELVRLGHAVTLYAARGSQTSAELVECSHTTLRDLGIVTDAKSCKYPYTSQLRLALSGLYEHDVVHVHHGTFPFHLAILKASGGVPIVWTDHNAIHNDGKPKLFESMAKLSVGLTALSDSHRNTVAEANWLATIHHGLPANLLNSSGATPSYLAFLGRVSPEKGITTAVRISEAGGFQLKVAAKVDKVDLDFYENEVKPLFARSNVDFIGEIPDEGKGPFLSAAIALVFPICWKEPFGLVMIEAMACGCPVIAFRMGSVPEIIEHGVTGFVVDTEEEAIDALRHVGSLNRKCIRQRFEERFTATTMVQKYIDVYERVIQQNKVLREAQTIARSLTLQGTENSITNNAAAEGPSSFEHSLWPGSFGQPIA